MLKVQEENSICTITLQRSEVRNAFNPELIEKLTQTFSSFQSQKTVRAVVLRGEGKVFCAGADLSWMKDMAKYSQSENKRDSEKLFEMFESIRTCPVPVITLVQGAAFGGALGLIAASDYVVADSKSQFCFSEVKIGLLPAVISAFILRKVPLSQIAPFMMSGQVFSPLDVLGSLVHELVDTSSLESEVAVMNRLELAAQPFVDSLLQAGPEAVRETKKLIHNLNTNDWAQTKQIVCQSIAERRVSAEGQEGLSSFFEKRKAHWVR